MPTPAPSTPTRRGAGPWLVAVLALGHVVAGPVSAQVRPGGGGFGAGAKPPAATSDDLLFHVLRRVTYGPDEATLAEIRALGVDDFLWRQLHPEAIDDAAVMAKLAADCPPLDDPTYLQHHFYYSYLVRAVESRRQLNEIMTQFWENHFDTVVPFGNNDVERHMWTREEVEEDELFRANALGRFRDLLEISAKSQAMMYFLDNYRNNVANGNENYARELLELHSLGVDCGYNQTDVQEVARIWTGWTGVDLVRDPTQCSTVPPRLQCQDTDGDGGFDFVFNPQAHDFTPKWDPNLEPQRSNPGLLFPPGAFAGGEAVDEGERILDHVARHPCTAQFIGRKLIEVFIADEPSDQLVDRIAGVFLQSDGDIRRVLEEIFASPEFRDPATFGNKVRTPLEFTIATLRATESTVTPGQGREYEFYDTWGFVRNQGMELFNFAIPTGYAERAPRWITANGFLQRWKYTDIVMNRATGRSLPTSTDPMAVTRRLELTTANEVIDHFTRMLLGTAVDTTRRDLLRQVLVDPVTGEFNPASAGQDARLREMIEQVLGMPEFNKQ